MRRRLRRHTATPRTRGSATSRDRAKCCARARVLCARRVFCLEPPGFGEHRKSQVDALTLGCIPVIFTPRTDTQLWPLHWGPFRKQSRVLMDMDAVLSGRVDVLQTLRAIPAAQVRAMQEAIGEFGNRMHYAADDSPNDALDIIMHALDEDASAPLAPPNDMLQIEKKMRCVDRWPDVPGRLYEIIQNDPRWRRAPQTCKALLKMGGAHERLTCADVAPSRKPGVLRVHDLCMLTCGMCGVAAQ